MIGGSAEGFSHITYRPVSLGISSCKHHDLRFLGFVSQEACPASAAGVTAVGQVGSEAPPPPEPGARPHGSVPLGNVTGTGIPPRTGSYGSWMLVTRTDRRQQGRQVDPRANGVTNGRKVQNATAKENAGGSGSRFDPLETEDSLEAMNDAGELGDAVGTTEGNTAAAAMPQATQNPNLEGRQRRSNVIANERQITNEPNPGRRVPVAAGAASGQVSNRTGSHWAAEEDEHVVIRGEDGGNVIRTTRVSTTEGAAALPAAAASESLEHHTDPPVGMDAEGDVVMEDDMCREPDDSELILSACNFQTMSLTVEDKPVNCHGAWRTEEEMEEIGSAVSYGEVLRKEATKCQRKTLLKYKIALEKSSGLEELLHGVCLVLFPKPSDYDARRDLIRIFNEIVKEIYGCSRDIPRVVEFGSFTMDLFAAKSDLDLSVNFSNVDIPRDRKISTLKKLAKKLNLLQRKFQIQVLLLLMLS
nr:protein HESO1-like [Ipomoea batatas]